MWQFATGSPAEGGFLESALIVYLAKKQYQIGSQFPPDPIAQPFCCGFAVAVVAVVAGSKQGDRVTTEPLQVHNFGSITSILCVLCIQNTSMKLKGILE